MKLDVAQADPEIGFRDCAGDVHRRSVCGVAQVDAAGRIGVDAADRLITVPADQDGGGMEDTEQILLRKLHGLHTIAISKFQLHGSPPVFRSDPCHAGSSRGFGDCLGDGGADAVVEGLGDDIVLR